MAGGSLLGLGRTVALFGYWGWEGLGGLAPLQVQASYLDR